MIKWVVFVGCSAALACISRGSLRVPGAHGFYRFFAWECILALIVLNVDAWFRTPLAWHQIASWALLTASIVPLVLGVHALAARGKPGTRRESEPELLAFERTSVLVTTGVYRFIRHPLYSSLLALAWGVYFKAPAWVGSGLALAATLLLYATARADEVECVRFFGPAYRDYMVRTKRFVPYIF